MLSSSTLNICYHKGQTVKIKRIQEELYLEGPLRMVRFELKCISFYFKAREHSFTFMCDWFFDDSKMDVGDKVSKGLPPMQSLSWAQNNLAIRP